MSILFLLVDPLSNPSFPYSLLPPTFEFLFLRNTNVVVRSFVPSCSQAGRQAGRQLENGGLDRVMSMHAWERRRRKYNLLQDRELRGSRLYLQYLPKYTYTYLATVTESLGSRRIGIHFEVYSRKVYRPTSRALSTG